MSGAGGVAWSTYCDRYGLSPIEARIFAKLAEGGVQSRLALMQHAKGVPHVEAHTASVHVFRMRKKLAPHGVRIERATAGYRLAMPVDA